jgi:hypothetical protein
MPGKQVIGIVADLKRESKYMIMSIANKSFWKLNQL